MRWLVCESLRFLHVLTSLLLSCCVENLANLNDTCTRLHGSHMDDVTALGALLNFVSSLHGVEEHRMYLLLWQSPTLNRP